LRSKTKKLAAVFAIAILSLAVVAVIVSHVWTGEIRPVDEETLACSCDHPDYCMELYLPVGEPCFRSETAMIGVVEPRNVVIPPELGWLKYGMSTTVWPMATFWMGGIPDKIGHFLASFDIAPLGHVHLAFEIYDGGSLGDAEDSLFKITPEPYRLVFPIGTPILYGIGTDTGVTVTMMPGSGLTGVTVLDLPGGKHVIHCDAPPVTENTVYDVTMVAHDPVSGNSEYMQLQIYIGQYAILVQYGVTEITDPNANTTDGDEEPAKEGRSIWSWILIVLLLILIASVIMLVVI